MKVVILDWQTITATNDIDASKFGQLGKVVIHDNLSDESRVLEACTDAYAVVLNKVNFSRNIIEKLSSSVRIILVCATGYDNIDVAAASARGIKVANVPGYGTLAVAQLAMQLILACATQLTKQFRYMQDNGWNKQAGLSITMHELTGKTLGIVGLGAIGEQIAHLANAFGMRIIAYNRTHKEIVGIQMVDLTTLAKEADYVSLSCALTEETKALINANFLQSMKPSAYIINTARGGLIDELALIKVLTNGTIAGAALDVLTEEPPQTNNPLLKMANVLLTPHIGWAPIEARQRCIDITCANLQAFIAGTPQNLLN